MEITTRREVLELDLLNNYIIFFDVDTETGNVIPDPQKVELNDDTIVKFMNSLGSFWHTEKDKLEVFIYYNTGEYLCQRNKLKYNFNTKTNYWETYNFKGAAEEDCQKVVDACIALRMVSKQLKALEVLKKVDKIEKQNLFYQKRYIKKKRERNLMLAASDWRVLPDVEESYEGEREMWILWRKHIRNILIKSPEEFETNLEFAKYLYDLKFPIDPNIYKNKYPNNEVSYLETEDQWVKYDAEASIDFINTRVTNFINYNKDYVNEYQTVKKEVYDIIKAMGLDESIPDFDITKFVIKDE